MASDREFHEQRLRTLSRLREQRDLTAAEWREIAKHLAGLERYEEAKQAARQADALAPAPPPSTDPPPPPTHYQPPPAPAQPGSMVVFGMPTPPPRVNSLALASMILGTVGLTVGCCLAPLWAITAPLGLAFGIIGLNQIKTSFGRQIGDGYAVAGIVLAVSQLGFCLGLLAIAVFSP